MRIGAVCGFLGVGCSVRARVFGVEGSLSIARMKIVSAIEDGIAVGE